MSLTTMSAARLDSHQTLEYECSCCEARWSLRELRSSVTCRSCGSGLVALRDDAEPWKGDGAPPHRRAVDG